MNKVNPYTIERYFHSFQRGESLGFKYFFDIYQLPLLYFAESILKHSQFADDIVEESFIKLWQNRLSIGHPLAIKSYLYTTVRNACIDSLRKEKTKISYQNEVLANNNGQDNSLLLKVVEAETFHSIYTAISELPPKMGRVFRMFYLEGKELSEIATELNVSVKTVKNQKTRALEILREKLAYLSILFLLIFIMNL